MSIRLSVCPQNFSDLNEIWYIGIGWWVIHDGMPCDQGQGHGGLKCAKMVDFKGCLFHQYTCNQNTNGELWYSKTIYILPCSALRDFQTYGVPPLANEFCLLWGVDRQSCMGQSHMGLCPVWGLCISSIMTVECLCVCNDRVRCGSTRRLTSGRRRRVMRTVTQTTVSVMSLTAWHCHCLTTTRWQPRRPTSRTDSMLITIWPVTWTDHVLGKCSTYIRRDYFIMSPPPESTE